MARVARMERLREWNWSSSAPLHWVDYSSRSSSFNVREPLRFDRFHRLVLTGYLTLRLYDRVALQFRNHDDNSRSTNEALVGLKQGGAAGFAD